MAGRNLCIDIQKLIIVANKRALYIYIRDTLYSMEKGLAVGSPKSHLVTTLTTCYKQLLSLPISFYSPLPLKNFKKALL